MLLFVCRFLTQQDILLEKTGPHDSCHNYHERCYTCKEIQYNEIHLRYYSITNKEGTVACWCNCGLLVAVLPLSKYIKEIKMMTNAYSQIQGRRQTDGVTKEESGSPAGPSSDLR